MTGYFNSASQTVWSWMGSLGSSLGSVVGYMASPEGLGQDTGALELGDDLEPIAIHFPCFPPAGLKDKVAKILAGSKQIGPDFADAVPAMDLSISYDTPRDLAQKVQQQQVRDELNEWLAPQVGEAETLMLGYFEKQVQTADILARENPEKLQGFLDRLPENAALLETFAASLKEEIESGAKAEIEGIYRKYAGTVSETCTRNFNLTVNILSNTLSVVSGVGGIMLSGLTGGFSGVMGTAGLLNSLAALRNAYNDYTKSLDQVRAELQIDLDALGNTVHTDRQGLKEVLLKLVDGVVGDVRKLVESGAKVPDGTYKLFGLSVENQLGRFYQGLSATTSSTEDRLKHLKVKTGEIQQASNRALNAMDKLLEDGKEDQKEFEELFDKISALNVQVKSLLDAIDHAETQLQAFQSRIEGWKGATSFADALGVAFNFGAGLFDTENMRFKMPEGTLEWLGAIGGAPGLLNAPWGDAFQFAKGALQDLADAQG